MGVGDERINTLKNKVALLSKSLEAMLNSV